MAPSPLRLPHPTPFWARWIGVASLAALLLAASLSASATILRFSLDTSSLSGTAGVLAFDFIDGDGMANNTATIGDFFIDGGTLGIADAEGGAEGTLIPGPVWLRDTEFFNSFLQPLTFGNAMGFTLTLTRQAPVDDVISDPVSDSFSFSLLDSSFLPLFATTDDPDPDFSGGALFQVDIDGSSDGILYTFAPVDESLAVSWTVEPVAAVPEPATAWLLGAGLLGGWMARRRRTSPPS